MIFAAYDIPTQGVRSLNMENLYRGCSVFLVGGAPTIESKALHRLESTRGILAAAINNAAKHFRPQVWFSGDHPECYDQRILADPGIIKFAPYGFFAVEAYGKPYRMFPSTVFYFQQKDTPVDKLLDRARCTPWHGNTLLASFHILYIMGIRRIYLYGSDFEPDGDKMYKHDTLLNDSQVDANKRLYNHLADNVRSLKTVFDRKGVELIDCSVKSKLSNVYRHMDINEAIDAELESFPEEAEAYQLRHGTEFADDGFRKMLGITTEAPAYDIL